MDLRHWERAARPEAKCQQPQLPFQRSAWVSSSELHASHTLSQLCSSQPSTVDLIMIPIL